MTDSNEKGAPPQHPQRTTTRILPAPSAIVHQIALRYVAAGLNVIPLLLDGSKAPAYCLPKNENDRPTWKEFEERQATTEELHRWFYRGHHGIGIVCGLVSGGLEVLDFDEWADQLFPAWYQCVSGIACALPIVRTPSGGYHVIYRCDEICGSKKIAKDKNNKETLIESRGEGAYIAAVGSPFGIHTLGMYEQVSGPTLPLIPTITLEERRELWRVARQLDLRPDKWQESKKQRLRELHPRSTEPPDPSKPWNDFAMRGSWQEILEPAGWKSVDGIVWTRVGKDFGCSAKVVIAKDGCEVLTVFSQNAGPLSPEVGDKQSFNKFEAYCRLHHRGDRSAAAKAVIGLGFGKRGAA